jgi:hypothetical protein
VQKPPLNGGDTEYKADVYNILCRLITPITDGGPDSNAVAINRDGHDN